jgi:hypothetical protein
MTDNEEIQELRRSTITHTDIEGLQRNNVTGLQHEITTALREVENGEQSKMIGFRDQSIAALLLALEKHEDDFEYIGNELKKSLDQTEQERFNRSEIIRLAVRAGLQQVAPDYYERLTAAAVEHTRKSL